MDFEFAPSSTWLPTAAIGAAGLLLGVSISSAAYNLVESRQAQQSRATIASLNSQISALKSTLKAQATALSTPLEVEPKQNTRPQPAREAQPQQQTQEAQATPQETPSPALAEQKKDASKPQPKETPKPSAKPAPTFPSSANIKPSAPVRDKTNAETPTPTTPTSAAPEAPPTPVTPEELKAAESSNSIEMTQGEKVGVAKFDGSTVVMKSGTRVRVGDRFSSGEKLLLTDPENGRIVTNRRTIIVTN